MNYGDIFLAEHGKNTNCLWVNTLPNNTVLIQYNNGKEVCQLVNTLKKLDISFSFIKGWYFVPNYLFGTNNYVECEPCDIWDDYSPVAYMFTHNGEYGYSQLTVYMSEVNNHTVLAYEHQCKGDVKIRYFMEK